MSKHTFVSSTLTGDPAGRPEKSGEEVFLVRALRVPEEVDVEVGPMYLCRFDDGSTVQAFGDELFPMPN